MRNSKRREKRRGAEERIAGYAEVVAAYGDWPAFHDWEVFDLRLSVSGSSSVSVALPWGFDPRALPEQYLRFTLSDVSDVELYGFRSLQNVIASIGIDEIDNRFQMKIDPVVGMGGFFKAAFIRVEVHDNRVNRSLNENRWYEEHWRPRGVHQIVSDFIYRRFAELFCVDMGLTSPEDRFFVNLAWPAKNVLLFDLFKKDVGVDVSMADHVAAYEKVVSLEQYARQLDSDYRSLTKDA